MTAKKTSTLLVDVVYHPQPMCFTDSSSIVLKCVVPWPWYPKQHKTTNYRFWSGIPNIPYTSIHQKKNTKKYYSGFFLLTSGAQKISKCWNLFLEAGLQQRIFDPFIHPNVGIVLRGVSPVILVGVVWVRSTKQLDPKKMWKKKQRVKKMQWTCWSPILECSKFSKDQLSIKKIKVLIFFDRNSAQWRWSSDWWTTQEEAHVPGRPRKIRTPTIERCWKTLQNHPKIQDVSQKSAVWS